MEEVRNEKDKHVGQAQPGQGQGNQPGQGGQGNQPGKGGQGDQGRQGGQQGGQQGQPRPGQGDQTTRR